jgi:hypothetical protein
MGLPYQTETYNEQDDTKQYINLFTTPQPGNTNALYTQHSSILNFTIGTDAYDNDPYTRTGKFSEINKTSSMNYSNGIITIYKKFLYISLYYITKLFFETFLFQADDPEPKGSRHYWNMSCNKDRI